MTDHPLPQPRPLGRFAHALLIGLRIYVIIAVPLVAFVFFHTLRP